MNKNISSISATKLITDKSWLNILSTEFQSSYFTLLEEFLLDEISKGKIIFPSANAVFNAFNLTPFNAIKVVIIGQDPYHGDGQAHGLSFSVQEGIKHPPSLRNIFKELEADIKEFKTPLSGNLTAWASQGVLLLNAILTVEANKPASHHKKGWETFTDAVIKAVSQQQENVVFFLWGKYAQQKEVLIDQEKHLVLKAAHPSPFSAYNGFFGAAHFSQANKYLKASGKTAINWKL